eukprot:3207632-Rhodomonas_salina.2
MDNGGVEVEIWGSEGARRNANRKEGIGERTGKETRGEKVWEAGECAEKWGNVKKSWGEKWGNVCGPGPGWRFRRGRRC